MEPLAVVADWIPVNRPVAYADGRVEHVARYRIEPRMLPDLTVPILIEHQGEPVGWVRAQAVVEDKIRYVGLITDPRLATVLLGTGHGIGVSNTIGGKGDELHTFEVTATRTPAATGTEWRPVGFGLSACAEAATALISADRADREAARQAARKMALERGHLNVLEPEVRRAIAAPRILTAGRVK